MISWSSFKISFQVFSFGIFNLVNGRQGKDTFVSVFLTLEVYLLFKICFLFLTISLDTKLLSQSSAYVANLFMDKLSATSKVRERNQV